MPDHGALGCRSCPCCISERRLNMGLIVGKTVISTIDVVLNLILLVYMYQNRNAVEDSGFKFSGVIIMLLTMNICAIWV